MLSIVPGSGDAWAWTIEEHGEGKTGVPLEACQIAVSGRRVPAGVQGATWRARIPLAPGDNSVRAECDDSRGAHLTSALLRIVERLADTPHARIDLKAGPSKATLDGSGSAPSEGTGAPIVLYAWSEAGADWSEAGVETKVESTSPTLDILEGARSRLVTLTVRDARGRTDQAVVSVPGTEVEPGPSEGAIVYGIVPPLYGDPPLQAVTAALADLAELGINVVWLTPAFESPDADFGYAVSDYFKVRSSFGGHEDLARLVREAHRLGLRVLLDLPANATSEEHPYFHGADHAESRTHDFYVRDSLGRAVHDFDWSNLPDLDYRQQEVARWMTEASLFWVRDVGVDGFRLDAAWGPRERAPEFWPAWVRDVRRVQPRALLIAEGPARDPYYQGAGFDVAYDWSGIGQGSWGDVFDDPASTPDRVRRALRERGALPSALHFLENNDTGARFLTRHGRGMTRAAAALLLTVPGVPCLFTGEERGVEYEPYAWHGRLPAGSAPELRAWYRKLIALRRRHPALWRGTFTPFDAARKPVVAFVRADAVSGERLLVLLNFQARSTIVHVPVRLGSEPLQELLTGTALRTAPAGDVRVDLGPWGAALVVLTS